MEEVKKYLEQEKPTFQEGFHLLCKYCRNQSLLSYIGRTGSMQHLLYNLKKVAKMNIKPHPRAMQMEATYNRQMDAPAQEPEQIQQPDDNGGADNANDPNECDDISLAEEIIANYKKRFKREELPSQLQELYDKNTDLYKEMRAYHEKMKQCNSDVGRAEFRSIVVSMANEIADRYELIEKKMLEEEQQPKQAPASVTPAQINSARAYISKMLKKENISDAQRLKIQEYYQMLVDNGAEINEETLQRLRDKSFIQ